MRWSWISIPLLAAWCAAGEPTYPVDVEADIIFPRPGGTYKKIYPFPIVYVVRNAAAVWPFGFSFSWMLTGEDLFAGGYLPLNESQEPSRPQTKGNLPEDQDPFYAITAVHNVVNATQTDAVQFIWSFDIYANCTIPPSNAKPDILGAGYYTIKNSFSFNLSDDGELPDFSVGDQCPEALHAARLSTVSDDGGCVMVEDEGVEPDPCQIKPKEDLGAMVAEKMLSVIGCDKGRQWPDENLKEKCNPDERSGESVADRARWSVAGAAGAFIIGTYYLLS